MKLVLKDLVSLPLREKTSKKKSAIWQCNFEVTAGEYVFIQAPSGTGKTTLMHYLYGIRNDYEGHIYWDNQLLQDCDPEKLASLRANQLSIIFQDMRLFPELTTEQNLEIKRVLNPQISPKRLNDWMERLGMADKKNQIAGSLSYGEQQRVAIIRALLQPFSVLLMDEPFSHLDAQNTQLAAALILEQAKDNNATLILADLDANNFFPYTKICTL